jgi:hypothetical protein
LFCFLEKSIGTSINSSSPRQSFSSLGHCNEQENNKGTHIATDFVANTHDSVASSNRLIKSNSNSMERASKKVKNDTYSITSNAANSPLDIKEFQKKLINLPTFTISDDASTQCLLPNALSTLSLFPNDLNDITKNPTITNGNSIQIELTTNKEDKINSPLKMSLNKSCTNFTSFVKELKASVSHDVFGFEISDQRQQQLHNLSNGLSLTNLNDLNLMDCTFHRVNEPNKVTTTITTTISKTVIPNRNIESIPFIITKAASPLGSNYFAENSLGINSNLASIQSLNICRK